MSEEWKEQQRWAAHKATAEELNKINNSIIELNNTLKELLEVIKGG